MIVALLLFAVGLALGIYGAVSDSIAFVPAGILVIVVGIAHSIDPIGKNR